jgi:hypothetical protein
MESLVEYIYVDSRTRDSNLFPNGNAYSVYLTNPIKNIKRVELVSASVPNTMYNLTFGSNVLIVGGTSNVSLAPSFFTSNTLPTEITNTGRMPTGMAVTYSANEGKFLFSNTSSFTLNVTTQEMATILGLPFGTVLNSTQVTSADLVYGTNASIVNKYIIKSSNVSDFTTNEMVFLDIEELRNQKLHLGSKISGNTFVSSSASHAFGPIPLDVQPNTVKTFKLADYDLSVDYPHVVEKLSRLTVNWRNINGNLLNFNGSNNNSFILRVTRTDVPPNKDRELGLPPPVPWDTWHKIYDPKYILGIALLIGVLLIFFTKKNITKK